MRPGNHWWMFLGFVSFTSEGGNILYPLLCYPNWEALKQTLHQRVTIHWRIQSCQWSTSYFHFTVQSASTSSGLTPGLSKHRFDNPAGGRLGSKHRWGPAATLGHQCEHTLSDSNCAIWRFLILQNVLIGSWSPLWETSNVHAATLISLQQSCISGSFPPGVSIDHVRLRECMDGRGGGTGWPTRSAAWGSKSDGKWQWDLLGRERL